MPKLNDKQIKGCLEKMGLGLVNGSVGIPSYRSDILHQIDLVEEVAIGYGYDNFDFMIPNIATIASEDPFEKFKNKIANIIVGIATNGLGLDFGSLLGTLKAGISNEDESQAYHKTKVFKNELKLAVIHLNKTLSKKKGTFTLLSASKYEIIMEGEITVIEAENEKALDKLYEIANHDAAALLKQLLDNNNNNSDNSNRTLQQTTDTQNLADEIETLKAEERKLPMEKEMLMKYCKN